MNHNRLIFFDTTLRDGEQAPGFGMSLDEKLQVAAALVRLGVDVIEAGFPAASPGDFEAVRTIAERCADTTIAGLARCHEHDIARTAEALQNASRGRIHVFLATSPIHREHKLGLDREQVLARIRAGVGRARDLCDDVEFSAEDASRTEPEFLVEAVSAAIEAGATTINIPDTVGFALPAEFGRLFAMLRSEFGDAATFSAHCHDDLGLALANSLAAVANGARQVECTINGIGERAGNCALEEIAMAIRTRPLEFPVAVELDTTQLCSASRIVSSITGSTVQPNKAIVGANAFAHEAGIHQHGVLAHSTTYEIMRPEDVGAAGSSLVLGKHSGRHALRQRIETLGFTLDEDAFDRLFTEFKLLADRKKELHDADIEALALGRSISASGPWQLVSLQTTSGTNTRPTASVELMHPESGVRAEAAIGDGPIDAAFRAIARATEMHELRLTDYQVHSVTGGPDAQGRVTVDCACEDRSLRGHGVSTDTVEASALAILDTVNRFETLQPSRLTNGANR